jgi:transposase-like protein
MKRRKWNTRAKGVTVVKALRGKPGAELCTGHQISQSLYYQWRDQFLVQAAKALEDPQRTRKEVRLRQENARLKQLVGELTLG